MSGSDKPVPGRPGRGSSAARLARALRVDHAGELAAVHIYRGQRAVLTGARGKGALAASLRAMQDQEARHLSAFDALLVERCVRPSLLAPVWRAAGFALGAGTALMGDKAAHACTEAVESVIEKHYAGQMSELAEAEPALVAQLSGFRDEEIGHLDQAVAGGAREAPAYPLLSAVIRAGCAAAIKVAEAI